MGRILIVEDEMNIRQLVRYNLEKEGFQVLEATDGLQGLKMAKLEKPDLVLLDLMLPDMDGLEVCRSLKGNPGTAALPVIMVTAKSEEIDKVIGLELGADDYLTKPFSMEELIYRMEAILRRTSGRPHDATADVYTIGKFTFDVTKQLLVYQDQTRKLTTKESELLELLCRHRNEVLERNFALKSIWIDDNYFNARSMDVYITKLRKYLSKDESVEILNIHGKGYKLLC